MTKVTVDQAASQAPVAPSQQVLADAAGEISFTLPDGRDVVLVKPDIIAQTRLMKVLGPELAANTTYVSAMTPLLYVRRIGEQIIPLPTADSELEVTLQKLGDVGYLYVGVAINEHWPQPNLEAVKTAVKKSAGQKTSVKPSGS